MCCPTKKTGQSNDFIFTLKRQTNCHHDEEKGFEDRRENYRHFEPSKSKEAMTCI